MNSAIRRQPKPFYILLVCVCFVVFGCKDAPDPVVEAPPTAPSSVEKSVELPLPVLLPLDTPRPVSPKDQTALAKERRPWYNYRQSDVLYEKYVQKGVVKTNPRPPGWERYEQDFMGAMLRDGKISYAIVHLLYREGYLDRKRRTELVAGLLKRVKASDGDHALKANLILSLILSFKDEI